MNARGKTVLFILILGALTGCSSFLHTKPDATADNLSLTSANAQLPLDARKARISFAYEPVKSLNVQEDASVYLLVTNLGSVTWPYLGERSGKYQIRIGNRWIDDKGNAKDDGRASLPYDLRPGETAEILIGVTAPEMPGEYTLEFDLVQEQVAWFGESGSATLRASVHIE